MLWATGDKPRISYHPSRGRFAIALDGAAVAGALPIPDRQYQRLSHAICMLLGWGVLLPFGACAAAGLKDRLGAPLWFRVHVASQLIGMLIALSGFCIALVHFGPVSEYGIHGQLGLSVMILGILQPINGLLRPHAPKGYDEKTSTRRNWEMLHKCSGWLALILAVPTMGIGTQLLRDRTDADFPGAATAITAIFITVVAMAALVAVRGYCCAAQVPKRQPAPAA